MNCLCCVDRQFIYGSPLPRNCYVSRCCVDCQCQRLQLISSRPRRCYISRCGVGHVMTSRRFVATLDLPGVRSDSQITRQGLPPTTHTPKKKKRRYKHRIPIATVLSMHTWIGTNTAATSGRRLRTKQCRGPFREEGVSMFENTLSCSKSSCHS